MVGEKNWKKEIKRGTIQLCVLSLLKEGPMYGYQIITALRERSNTYFDLKEGTIYPALYRLEKEGYAKSRWLQKDGRPPRNYYSITEQGKKHMQETLQEWKRMVKATTAILGKKENTA